MNLLTLKVEKTIKSNSSGSSESLLEIVCADTNTAQSVKKNLELLFTPGQNYSYKIYLLNVDYNRRFRNKELNLPSSENSEKKVKTKLIKEDFSELEKDLF